MNNLKNGLVLLTALSFNAMAGEKIDQSLAVDGATSVEIENLRGDVLILGKSGGDIEVKGELDDEATKFIFEKNGSVVLIKVDMPRHLDNGWNKNETNLTINVPDSLNINFSGVSTDVIIKDIKADVSVGSVSGHVNVENVSQDVELNSVSGDIVALNLGHSTHLSNVSGNITTSGSTGNLMIKAVSGDIEAKSEANAAEVKNVSGEITVKFAQIDDLSLSTVSGDVDADVGLNDNGQMKLSSVSGDFYINFLNDVQARFRLRSNAGGDLINKLTSARAQEDKYGPSSRLTFETGNGSSRVSGSTVSGNIKLRRK